MKSEVTTKLTQLLHENTGAPFLFIGSGFSMRYIGLQDWKGLLKHFCSDIRNFGYYYSQSNNDLPRTASKMAEDFNEVWWKSDSYCESRECFSDEVVGVSSSLKYEIAKYTRSLSKRSSEDKKLKEELQSLSQLNVDGIITTNWDLFLEELFPDYRVFIGQEELLFSNPQSIAEIYKIHGCSTQPNSLVLTEEDYSEFERKKPISSC